MNRLKEEYKSNPIRVSLGKMLGLYSQNKFKQCDKLIDELSKNYISKEEILGLEGFKHKKETWKQNVYDRQTGKKLSNKETVTSLSTQFENKKANEIKQQIIDYKNK